MSEIGNKVSDAILEIPLSALLSQAWVAFAIEFDNEFEHQMPHRTTRHGSTATPISAPWLGSMAIWMKFMRFIPESGITVREFKGVAGLTKSELRMWLIRLSKWWGYIAIEKGAEDPRDWLLRPTAGGRKALQVWRPLTGIIEKRWEERFGKRTMNELRQSMQSVVNRLNPDLADCLPILGFHMLSPGPDPERRAGDDGTISVTEYALPTLLSKVLLALAIQYERESGLSLAISANVLRLSSEEALRIRDIPRLSGVSKEAIAMALKRLEKGGFASVRLEAKNSRAKVLVLTAKGQQARETYYRLLAELEKRWQASFGHVVLELRRALEQLACESTGGKSPLFAGLEPYPEGWRASLPKREVLPHYPMVLHRGGFPDGS